MRKKFRRTIEDFVCENCGKKVKGTGYTNHCPSCLWSKHVDIYPGDRSCDCQGLMEPTDIIVKNDTYVIVHKCVKCRLEKINKSSIEDDFESILSISCKKSCDIKK